jgi:hypothetical protein
MTKQQWEYMTVEWSRAATEKTRPRKNTPPLTPYRAPQGRSDLEFYRHEETKIIIRRGGAKKEEIIIWSSEGGEKNSLLNIYNKFGFEGWEMVSQTPYAMTMHDEVNGFPNSSGAVIVTIWFKRSI